MLSSRSFKSKIKAVLFDLDGTLLDTAPDLASALNASLAAEKYPILALETIRPVVSEGVSGLLKLAFTLTDKNADFPKLRHQFIEYYSQHICEHTHLFPGIEPLILYLQENRLNWGIVTNKQTALSTKLIAHFPLLKNAKCLISGDTLAFIKPNPKPLLHACECIECLPENCVYIGDAKQDIDAANAAGMASLLALYGYIPSQSAAKTWGATAMVSTPFAIIDWLEQHIKLT